jgi:transposase-like protein
MDETFVRVAGKWMYLFRAVDAGGQTVDFYLSVTRDREAAKIFLKRALANPDNLPPGVPSGTDCAVMARRSGTCKVKVTCKAAADNTPEDTVTTGSNRTTVMLSAACVLCSDHGRQRLRGRWFKGSRRCR